MSDTATCACGASVPPDARACPACGAPVGIAPTGAAIPVGLGAPADGPAVPLGLWKAPELRSARLADDEEGADLGSTMQLAAFRPDEPPTLVRADGTDLGERAGSTPNRGHAAPWASTAALPAVRRRWNRWMRAVPLFAVLGVFAAALAAASALRDPARPEASPGAPAPAPPFDATVTLPAGEFTLGLTEDNKEVVLALCYQLSDNYTTECRRQYLTDLGEYPARTVAFDALVVDRYEVSNAAWAQCEQAGACPERDIGGCRFYSVARGLELREEVPASMLGPEEPAVCVTFDEAESFCRWRGMRLPTADEWERAGRSGDDRLQPWGPFVMPGLLNWGERVLRDFPIPGRVDGFELTAPVDEYRSGATDDGIHNMLGNVAEWVAAPTDDHPDATGVRGSSYIDNAGELRLTWHQALNRDARRSTVGFRCVR